jgi:molybdate transport system ATP-binding protein
MSEAPALEVDIAIDVGGGAFRVEAKLDFREGVLVLFGPSGAGKTLTLRAIAGLQKPSRGVVRVRGETLFDASLSVPAHERRVGYVPQQQALMPHLDVLGNVVFGLPREERKRPGAEVMGLLEELGLSHLKHARASELSGGERQRVALGRALAVHPRLLLLDEPLSALDRPARVALGRMLKDVIARRSLPAVLVTHDAEEALSLGDEMVRFERGRTVEAGTPREMLGHGAGACPLCGQERGHAPVT